MKGKDSLNVKWSDEDESYIATCPERPGLSAFGDSWSEAAAEAELALEGFIAVELEDELKEFDRKVREGG